MGFADAATTPSGHPTHDPLVSGKTRIVDPSVDDVLAEEKRLRFGGRFQFKPTEHYAIGRTAFWQARDILGDGSLTLGDQSRFLKGMQWPDFPTSAVASV
jgi:hypothetical protein